MGLEGLLPVTPLKLLANCMRSEREREKMVRFAGAPRKAKKFGWCASQHRVWHFACQITALYGIMPVPSLLGWVTLQKAIDCCRLPSMLWQQLSIGFGANNSSINCFWHNRPIAFESLPDFSKKKSNPLIWLVQPIARSAKRSNRPAACKKNFRYQN